MTETTKHTTQEKMLTETEDPSSMNTSQLQNGGVKQNDKKPPLSWVKTIFSSKNDISLRETIEGFMEEDRFDDGEKSITEHEKEIIKNVLQLRDMCAADVMVPRADIVAINEDISKDDFLRLLSEKQYSRLPVYKDTMDDVIGTVHVKDVIASLARGETIDIKSLVRPVTIISPAMLVLDLLYEMRTTKKHMVMVVDEFGGIDGLVTIGDLVEDIVGEIDDEHIPDEQPEIITQKDGTLIADARYDLDEFEEEYGIILNDEEREENDTIGGLIFSIAGRVPARGEILTHETGTKFEILDADPRRVYRVCIRNIPN